MPDPQLNDCLRAGSAPWYALKVRTRSEPVSVNALGSRGYTTFCPFYSRRKRYSDRWKTANEAMFPGYIFCRFDFARKGVIVSSPGVEYIVGSGDTLSIIPDVEIENIRRAIEAGAGPSEYLKVGQRVRVCSGALTGVEGIFTRTETGDRLVLSVSLLQRSVSATIHRDQVVVIS